ncbi:hypothetical protein SOCEGT47_085310 [Sorangium cellulosum]|uniref:Uncharacterized protein n=1 Tax=Sorangium cellulosum TaxID=56 RepID=A0A4P2QER3_SORCE|nr:hypothetical protein [Sorangium cellulosum]AUX27931.1 hypothetical protein SOCEGT47_085310 [Sorangium cellulosum]
MDLDLLRLDRDVARAARAWRAAVRDLRRAPAPADADPESPGAAEAAARLRNPLDPFRRVSSRTTYLELTGQTPGLGAELGIASPRPPAPPDPTGLAAPLADWVHALTLERVVWADRVRLAAAWRAASIAIDLPEPARMSPREARLGLLADPTDAGRRRFAEALARGAGAVADAARILVERRHEAARRLAEGSLRAIEIPGDPPDAVLDAAEALLRRTESMIDRAPTWHDALGRAVGRDAASGWPARLTPRWIEELFRATPLTEGLAIDLGPLPRPLGAASFARALARFGAALALASGGGSFALAHAPFDLRRARRAALFGGLVADPVFCARALGLGRGRALDQARATARGLLLSLRLDAARASLVFRAGHDGGEHVLLRSSRDRGDRFEEATARALGAPIPGALAGVLPALEPDAAVRLAGALLGARDRRDMIERFDEDWFRNPRAAEAIRDEDGAPPASRRATAAALEEGIEEMLRSLASL